jgi:hypothetical protein
LQTSSMAAMAAARHRRSKPPRAGLRCPGGSPSLPLPPLHRNRCGAPSFVVGIADSCHPGRSSWPPICRPPATPAPAGPAGDLRVSRRPLPLLPVLPSPPTSTPGRRAMGDCRHGLPSKVVVAWGLPGRCGG